MPKSLNEAGVRALVGERSFSLGQEYFSDGAIHNQRLQGTTLKADCEGRSAPSYRLWAQLDDKGVAEAACTCPVGGGGNCKHVAALLLTWIHHSETFRAVEDLDASLARRSRDELIALIKHMLRREPDLEMLIETPLPSTAAPAGGRERQVDPEAYARQARVIFRGIDYSDSYGAESGVAADLEAIMEIGDGFLEQQRHADAAAVYEGVADAVLEHYEEFHDEGGDLAAVVQECTEGLASCLADLPEGDPARETILKALFAIYRADVELGGLDLSAGAPEAFVEGTSKAERQLLASWVREALPGSGTSTDKWRREHLGGMLLDLEADELDDDTFLRICRETGRTRDLVDRLLSLDRLEEGVEEARRAGDYDLLTLTDVFARHGHADVVERLIEERARTSSDSRLVDWLKQRHFERGDFAAALALAREGFDRHPSLAGYEEIRGLAQRIGQWDELRPGLLDQFAKAQQTSTLIQIHLSAGEVERALELLRAAPRAPFWYGVALDLQVARAAEARYPRDAADIYRRHVERIVEQRDRAAYGRAAQLIQRTRELYERIGERQTWDAYLADVRSRTRPLRAFKAELEAVGL